MRVFGGLDAKHVFLMMKIPGGEIMVVICPPFVFVVATAKFSV